MKGQKMPPEYGAAISRGMQEAKNRWPTVLPDWYPFLVMIDGKGYEFQIIAEHEQQAEWMLSFTLRILELPAGEIFKVSSFNPAGGSSVVSLPRVSPSCQLRQKIKPEIVETMTVAFFKRLSA
jgi:hypothetical protein